MDVTVFSSALCWRNVGTVGTVTGTTGDSALEMGEAGLEMSRLMMASWTVVDKKMAVAQHALTVVSAYDILIH